MASTIQSKIVKYSMYSISVTPFLWGMTTVLNGLTACLRVLYKIGENLSIREQRLPYAAGAFLMGGEKEDV